MPIEPYNKHKEKSAFFFSASNSQDAVFLHGKGINEILVSYFYVQRNHQLFSDLIKSIKSKGGLFMVDSGCFSFFYQYRNVKTTDHLKPDFWLPYMNAYLQWVNDNIQYIDAVVNMDLDNVVGIDAVDKWNQQFFEPLRGKTQICYVGHPDYLNKGADKTGIKRIKSYCDNFDYVGISREALPIEIPVIQYAKNRGTRLHGFAWTSIPRLISNPLFSVDSTTWLGGVRYGTSYMHDGQNFRTNDYKKKHFRKTDKNLCLEHGIDFDKLLKDEKWAVNHFNLLGWQEARNKYMKHARIKLSNEPVIKYFK